MSIKNILENIVLNKIDEVLKEKKDICQCSQCKLDIACYTLNHLKPKYIISERGFIHEELKKYKELQTDIDILSTIFDAINIIMTNRRADTNHQFIENKKQADNNDLCYNFPHIVGHVYNGENLEPEFDMEISLYRNNKLVEMEKQDWKNPYKIVKPVAGVFSFWPKSQITDKVNKIEEFNFEIRLSKKGFKQINRFFTLRQISDQKRLTTITKDRIFHLEDFFIFPSEEVKYKII